MLRSKVQTRNGPNGMRASQGSGMVSVEIIAVESNSQSVSIRTMFGMPNRSKQITSFAKMSQNKIN